MQIYIILTIITTLNAAIIHNDLYEDFACYQCASDAKHKGSCSVVDNKPELLVICPRNKQYCLKKVVDRSNVVTVERGCTDLGKGNYLGVGCMFMVNEENEEEVTLCVCDKDQCNGSIAYFDSFVFCKVLTIVFVPIFLL